MISLSTTLFVRCKEEFLNCDVFDSHDELVGVFEIEELKAFQYSLPEAHSKEDRVIKTIRFLLEKGRHGKQAVLVTFIQVLIAGFIDKEDERHSRLEELLKEVEEAINSLAAQVSTTHEKEKLAGQHTPISIARPVLGQVPSPVVIGPAISDKPNIPETRQHGDILLINKYCADLMDELRKVKDARNLFGDMQKVIYPDKCKRLIKSLSNTATLVQKFSHVIDRTEHLPLVSHPSRLQLAEVLHHLDALLKKVMRATSTFCPDSHTTTNKTITKRQDVYQTLNELAQNFDKMRKLMRSFNSADFPAESDAQLAGANEQTTQGHSQTSII
ncbi:MAG TPA: hypothetical protein VFA09_21935 [Ktedonobacteraceae bacterium]|nr:hypothetical protein [Ktedonobacteraceae bacterium]